MFRPLVGVGVGMRGKAQPIESTPWGKAKNLEQKLRKATPTPSKQTRFRPAARLAEPRYNPRTHTI